MDRLEIVHEKFLKRVAETRLPQRDSTLSFGDAGIDAAAAVSLFRVQVQCRQLDRAARRMQARGEGFYTIGSSGHEGMAAVAAAFRPDDMAFLHYRDAAFLLQRMTQAPGETPIWDSLLSFGACSEEPISGGRHKVLGSKRLHIPPQTSTIASHLPKAVGAAYSVRLARLMQPEHKALADDAVVVCCFGDASLNHSTAQGAINTAAWTSYQGGAMPIVFICEDNGIGISTRTPTGWVAAAMEGRPSPRYCFADGLDFLQTLRVAGDVAQHVRQSRKPAFLHLRTVRLGGHAGSDVPSAYLTREEIEGDEAHDPLLYSAAILMEHGALSAPQILDLYEHVGAQVDAVCREVGRRPKLRSFSDVISPLVPGRRRSWPAATTPDADRRETFGSDVSAMEEPQHMARLINWALTDSMLEHPEVILAGEDIGPKGGVYGVTLKLHARFGPGRVINTLLDEQAILGLAIGLGHNGFIPVPEIQFLAYLHNAEDQIRGEAATLSFFSNGQYSNPMVVRLPGLAYQRGFGGHFHNDNSIAVLRDIPGVVIACPSNGHDAVGMLREAIRLAREEQRVVAFIEPIALYMTRDLHAENDGRWKCRYPQPGFRIPVGQVGVHGVGADLAIVSYGNGHYLSRQAMRILEERHSVSARAVDLRWLAPLPDAALMAAIRPCRHVLIVDECRATGSQSEALMTLISEATGYIPTRIAAADCFIPTGPAYAATLPTVESIVDTAVRVVRGGA